MQSEILLFIIIFLYGIVIGSFLNVLIYRIPLQENIVTERSHCMNCGRQIQWYDLIPLFSYLFLRGRCRYCKEKISVQYPLIEGMNGCGYVLIFLLNGFTMISIFDCLLFSILVVISVIDWRNYEIPMCLNVAIGILAIIKIFVMRDNPIGYLIGFCVVSGFLLVLFLLTGGKGIGGGDIKMMAAAGLFLGWKQIILAFVLGCILGAVIHLVLMKLCNKGKVLAFGPYLSAGMVVVMIFGERILNWYLNLICF